uniref:Putative secreted peptide n=1 Tax=Anopheles braziliensis TaxID=58242 RepID=A0A2M3ZRS5_9DIPT
MVGLHALCLWRWNLVNGAHCSLLLGELSRRATECANGERQRERERAKERGRVCWLFRSHQPPVARLPGSSEQESLIQ